MMGFIDSDIRRADTYNTEYQCSEKGDCIDISDKIYEHFWKSQLYLKSYFTKHIDNKKFRYYDKSNFTKFLFFGWVTDWTKYIAEDYVEPYKLHPLPVPDQILRWQPIFSKHVSDGLVRLESYQTLKSKGEKIGRNQYPYKSILLRALFLTFWKRILFGLVGIILINILSMSISILVKKLLKIFNNKSFIFYKVLLFLFLIIILQLIDGLITENFTFFLNRLVHMIQYSFSITMFQHGLCHRRKYSNNIEGSNSLGTCNKILHSFDSGSECTKNPLFCPALRHQNKDITPRIFTFEFIDSYYISLLFESFYNVVNFFSNFIYGIFLMSYQIKMNLSVLYIIGLLFLFFMVFVEIVNTYILNFIYLIKDYRISKCIEIISGLPLIYRTLQYDIAMNIITESRNNELGLIVIRTFLTFLNNSLYIICINLSFYILIRYFVKSIENASVITDIDTAGFLTTLYIFLKIIDSMNMLPHAIKRTTTSCTSYNRLKKHINNCSPNFYISDNMFTGRLQVSSDVNEVTNDLDKDVIVLYKDATFSWASSRSDALNKNGQTFLEDVNFQIKRGEIVIVTGVSGEGKSNFIKSVLGEMTLVEGSMAVVPLYTSMPIFYASQDIWLQQGTIRSNITFGYRFDEEIYNDVLKAVELESDFLSWEMGDLRVLSNYGYCLSGGQRVRMEMARALYAYLIFNQVNKQYNNSRCSFLMCLDSPFHGLDPFVSKTVFYNLFNAKSGIIVKDDLAVILSSSKRSLDICLSQSDLKEFPNIPVYQIKNLMLKFYFYLYDFNKTLNSPTHSNYNYFTSSSSSPCQINFFDYNLIKLCLSGSNTRMGRPVVTQSKYEHSFNVFSNQFSGIEFNPYFLYLLAAGFVFLVFVLLTFVLTIMDNLKFVLASNLSDYITKYTNDFNDGEIIDLSEVKSHSVDSLSIVFIFISLIIVLSLLSTLFLSLSCIIASRRIHEYCISSVFNNSSTLVKIKNYTFQVITYLSSDIFQIDEGFGSAVSSVLTSLIRAIINIGTLFYLIPFSIPLIFVSLSFLSKFVFLKYINSSKNLQLGSLESMSHINTVCENAISGSAIYRSFKREWELFYNLMEHTDYYMRCRLLNKAFVTWCSILTNWIFSFTTLLILVIPILFDKFTKYKLKVGYFGLGLSLSINAIKSFTTFSMDVTRLEIYMCSIQRFKSFIPIGSKCVFGKYINIHEEDLVVNPTNDVYKITKKQLLKRRSNEFNEKNRSFNCFKRMFYKPKINVIDVTQYVSAQHEGLILQNVYVYTSPDPNKDCAILKGITVSTHRSDIIGIIGRTGAGKTTLLSVLESTARNRTGRVLLDGTDLNDIPKNVTRHIIGVLPQLPFVFKGWTLRRFLDPRKLFSDEEINKALESCGLLEFVNELQGGKKLDSILIAEDIVLKKSKTESFKKSKKGSKSFKSERSLTIDDLQTYYEECEMLLSGSQLRTLAFAKLVLYRYFYRIIIIDEPPENSNDQSDSTRQERVIQAYDLLEKFFKHCTCFVTAHDASVLKSCTSVWVIHNGRLVKICKREEIPANESISSIIENIVK